MRRRDYKVPDTRLTAQKEIETATTIWNPNTTKITNSTTAHKEIKAFPTRI